MQLSLFALDTPPHAQHGRNVPTTHTSDPVASHQADEHHRASGKRDRHRVLVLGLVIRHPAKTACELWSLATPEEKALLAEMQEVRRRLTDLLHMEDVKQTASRTCTVKGTTQTTWRVADAK